jgi:hypothetical protein
LSRFVTRAGSPILRALRSSRIPYGFAPRLKLTSPSRSLRQRTTPGYFLWVHQICSRARLRADKRCSMTQSLTLWRMSSAIRASSRWCCRESFWHVKCPYSCESRVILSANASKCSNRGQHDCHAPADQTARLPCVRSFSHRDSQVCMKGKCAPTAKADDCCRASVPDSSQWVPGAAAGYVPPLIHLVTAQFANFVPSLSELHFDTVRHPPPLNRFPYTPPLLI